MQPVSTMIVGRIDRCDEGIDLPTWLDEHCGTKPRCFAQLTDALAHCIQSAWEPDIVVIWQSWPDEFSSREIHRLLSY